VFTVDGTFPVSCMLQHIHVTFARAGADYQVNGVPGSEQHGVRDFWTGVKEVDASKQAKMCRNIVV
jgi:hypothetical protein